MATSLSSMLIIPSSKIRYQGCFQNPKFPLTTPPRFTRNQKNSIKLVTRNHSTLSNNVVNVNNYKYNGISQLPEVWRQIQGENDWAGLLEPMDPLLKSEVIRYGEMAQACYDAFDGDLDSKYYGTCRFSRESMFGSLDMKSHEGYTVTSYLHITAKSIFKFIDRCHPRWPREYDDVHWAGYVAVSDDATTLSLGRRDITVAWRGTVMSQEYIDDAKFFPVPVSSHDIPSPDSHVTVETGFLEMYTDKEESSSYCTHSAREQVLAEVKRLLEIYSNEEVSITVTGHSLGSALAILSAYDIVESKVNLLKFSKRVPISVMSFSGPMVGNERFKKRLEGLGVKVLRVVNVHDWVPALPGPLVYSHVGIELALNHKDSPYLSPNATGFSFPHNLEVLLHLLDGYRGKGQRFVAPSNRDPALVNKYGDYLKEVCMIPPNWWQYENKGMIRTKDGRWTQPNRPVFDVGNPKVIHHHLTQLGLVSSFHSDIFININNGGEEDCTSLLLDG